MRSIVYLLALGLAACGGRKPMDDKGKVIFWAVTGTSQNFSSSCSDDPNFTAFFDPSSTASDPFFQQFQIGSTFAYRLSSDGTSATAQQCQTLDAATCSDVSMFVFQVAGDDLILGQDVSIAFQNTTACAIDDALDWDLTDSGQTMTMALNNTLSLTGTASTCSQINTSEMQMSPNGKGIEGCVVNFSVDTQLQAVGG